ncbi:hypothetical protein THIARS_40091 [Thiomonas delicata]|uniref:Uncharacterized protein n=1 Tax=Thiomonas delicata TaxID=364030 RepID=A0A238CZQ2_THIDL|nr:hypothetical protein THIARS_40091 [Thiomonas delicata]
MSRTKVHGKRGLRGRDGAGGGGERILRRLEQPGLARRLAGRKLLPLHLSHDFLQTAMYHAGFSFYFWFSHRTGGGRGRLAA